MRINPADKFSALPPVIPPPSLVAGRFAGFRFHRLLVPVWLLSLVGVPGRAAAETYTWTGATLRDTDLTNDSDLWDTPKNWSPVGVPGVEDIAVIPGGDTVNSSGPRVVAALRKTGGGFLGNFSVEVTGVPGSSVFSEGSITGQITVAAGSSLTINTTLNPGMSAAFIHNFGTILITGSPASFLNGHHATFNNYGLLQIARDGLVLRYNSATWGGVINNTGTIVKTTGTGTATFDWTLDNNGVAGSDSGTLAFAAGSADLGSAGVFRSGTIDARTEFSGGTHLLNAGVRFTGPGRGRISNSATMTLGGAVEVGSPGSPAGGFEITGGTLSGTGSLSVVGGGGTVVWTSGNLNTTLTVGVGARLEIDTAATPYLSPAGIVNNAGTAVVAGPAASRLEGYNGTFNNSGLLQIARDGLVFHNYSGITTLNNTGTMQLDALASSVTLGWDYKQSATGNLNLKIGGTNPVTPQFDQFNCAGGVSLGGALSVSLINGFVPTVGGTFTVMTYGSRSGTFATFNSPGAYFSRAYGASDLTLTATNAPTNYAEWKAAYFAPGSPDAADNADTDHDGISTLLEFATGGNPLISEAPTSSVAPPAGGFIDFFYTRSIIAIAELQFQAEWNDMLLPGGWSDIGVTESILSNNGSVQRVKAHVPTSGRDSRFVHLSVTKP